MRNPKLFGGIANMPLADTGPDITLRDIFAGMAMAGYRASENSTGDPENRVASLAVADADALLAALEKGGEE